MRTSNTAMATDASFGFTIPPKLACGRELYRISGDRVRIPVPSLWSFSFWPRRFVPREQTGSNPERIDARETSRLRKNSGPSEVRGFCVQSRRGSEAVVIHSELSQRRVSLKATDLGFDEAVSKGVSDKLRGLPNIELPHQTRPMRLDRFRADRELDGDFFSRETICDEM